MNVDITNHLVPWTTVKKLLRAAWGEGYEAGALDVGRGLRECELTPNPHQEDS